MSSYAANGQTAIRWKDLNRYERENAREKVYGYMVPRRTNETASQEFDRAKAECLLHLQRQIEQVKVMSFVDFMHCRRAPETLPQPVDDSDHEDDTDTPDTRAYGLRLLAEAGGPKPSWATDAQWAAAQPA